jgi:ribosomal protein S18 acetylase RimI-like enzyme
MNIREASEFDFVNIWPIFNNIVSAGETYPYPRDTTKDGGLDIWIRKPDITYILEENKKVLGTYYIKKNQPGSGSHVCNCGYMVSSTARGRGVATKMCEHSQIKAIEFGFKAMQFNLVVSTNRTAIILWEKLGFDTIGRLPNAFNHLEFGYIDAFIMYKWLGP